MALLATPLAMALMAAQPATGAPLAAQPTSAATETPPPATEQTAIDSAPTPTDAAAPAPQVIPEAAPPPPPVKRRKPDLVLDADGQPLPMDVSGDPDPFERLNRLGYAITQPIDRFILRPIAMLYGLLIPEPIRDGIHNALENIFTPTVLANDILQLRPKRAGQTLARFAINSTVGLGGLFDAAKRKPFNIAAHPNGFGDTLGVAGAESGPYLYIPVLGPSTVRDLLGLIGDAFTQPLLLDWVSHQRTTVVRRVRRSIVTQAVSVSTQGAVVLGLSGIDARQRADADLQALKKSAVDPYATLRSSYLQNREGEIAMLKAKDGAQAQVPAFEDPLEDPAAQPAPQPSTPKPSPAPQSQTSTAP